MNTTRTRFCLTAALLLGAGIASAEARQEQADELPDAESLIELYVETIGGSEAVLRSTSSRSTGRFEMPAAGVTGQLEVFTARPNRTASVVTIPGFGEFRNGFDGEVGWAMDPMAGPRVLEGLELAALVDQADRRAAVRDTELFSAMETVEHAEFAGEACYKVRLEWKSGRESFDCYSVETGLLIATLTTQTSPMGSVEVTTIMSDYQEFGEVLLATRIVQNVMGQEQIMTLEGVEFDVVEPAAFALPAEIEAILAASSDG